jgi:hypothetical protein
MDLKKEKIKYLVEIQNLELKGFRPGTYYNINSDINDIKFEYEHLKSACDIKIKENLLSEIEEFKKYVKNYPRSFQYIDISTDLEIIESIHKTLKQSYESYKKQEKLQEEMISNVFLADKLIEDKYNISFIGGLLDKFK